MKTITKKYLEKLNKRRLKKLYNSNRIFNPTEKKMIEIRRIDILLSICYLQLSKSYYKMSDEGKTEFDECIAQCFEN